MNLFLDIVLTILHLFIIGFNLLGWIWKKTRKLHLVFLGLTLLSWFVLGFWHGWGYCFLTDWHWNVKRALGETDLPNSFIKYFVDGVTGRPWDAGLIDTLTLAALLLVVLLSVYLNFIHKRR